MRPLLVVTLALLTPVGLAENRSFAQSDESRMSDQRDVTRQDMRQPGTFPSGSRQQNRPEQAREYGIIPEEQAGNEVRALQDRSRRDLSQIAGGAEKERGIHSGQPMTDEPSP
jgi:hypothetical protein